MIVNSLLVPAASWMISQPHAFCPRQTHELRGIRPSSFCHVESDSTTALHAFMGGSRSGSDKISAAPTVGTQLQYRSVVDSYLDDIDDIASEDSPATARLIDGKDWSMLQQFRVIRETTKICYPHLLMTQLTWNDEAEIERRLKFVPLLSPVQRESFEAMFRLVDRDRDGLVCMGDLSGVVESIKLDEENRLEMPRYKSQVNLEGKTKLLSLKEFMGIASEAEFYNLLLETFGGMDTKNTGYIEVNHVSAMLRELTEALYNPRFDGDVINTENECTQLIDELIANSKTARGDAVVFNYEEFTRSLLGMK